MAKISKFVFNRGRKRASYDTKPPVFISSSLHHTALRKNRPIEGDALIHSTIKLMQICRLLIHYSRGIVIEERSIVIVEYHRFSKKPLVVTEREREREGEEGEGERIGGNS